MLLLLLQLQRYALDNNATCIWVGYCNRGWVFCAPVGECVCALLAKVGVIKWSGCGSAAALLYLYCRK